jgi:hypothetical protein
VHQLIHAVPCSPTPSRQAAPEGALDEDNSAHMRAGSASSATMPRLEDRRNGTDSAGRRVPCEDSDVKPPGTSLAISGALEWRQ